MYYSPYEHAIYFVCAISIAVNVWLIRKRIEKM